MNIFEVFEMFRTKHSNTFKKVTTIFDDVIEVSDVAEDKSNIAEKIFESLNEFICGYITQDEDFNSYGFATFDVDTHSYPVVSEIKRVRALDIINYVEYGYTIYDDSSIAMDKFVVTVYAVSDASFFVKISYIFTGRDEVSSVMTFSYSDKETTKINKNKVFKRFVDYCIEQGIITIV